MDTYPVSVRDLFHYEFAVAGTIRTAPRERRLIVLKAMAILFFPALKATFVYVAYCTDLATSSIAHPELVATRHLETRVLLLIEIINLIIRSRKRADHA
jgi:hypothetical protein